MRNNKKKLEKPIDKKNLQTLTKLMKEKSKDFAQSLSLKQYDEKDLTRNGWLVCQQKKPFGLAIG